MRRDPASKRRSSPFAALDRFREITPEPGGSLTFIFMASSAAASEFRHRRERNMVLFETRDFA